jgi:hypothetical protein
VPQTDVQHVTVTLPMGVWLGAEKALINQRYELQRWLTTKTNASSAARSATQHALAEIQRTIDAITDATASVGD